MGKHNKFTFRQHSRRAAIVVYDWIAAIVAALTAILIVLTYLLRIVAVDGDSMIPTMQDGDRLLLTYTSSGLEQGDIVVIDRYDTAPLIKRVIASGGDTIEIVNSKVFVNNVQLVEPYIKGTTSPRDMDTKITIPPGYIFVMGDNRTVSKDSRMDVVGLISEKDVVGKARWCIWPPESFGAIYDK